MQILEALPQQLAILVCGSAMSQHDAVRCGLRPDSDAHQDALLSLTALLPAALKPLVLCAYNPALERSHSFTMTLPDVPAAAPLMHVLLDAAQCYGELTSLSLLRCCDPDVRPAVRRGDSPARAPAAAVWQTLSLVSSMTALLSLRVEVKLSLEWHGQRGSIIMAVARVLPSLQHLTALCIRDLVREGAFGELLAPHLRGMSDLQTLVLDGCGLFSRRSPSTTAHVEEFASALRTLCALTHLSLGRNLLVGSLWPVLGPVIASSPVVSLNMAGISPDMQASSAELQATLCGLDKLRRLRISDMYTPAAFPLERMSRLTSLDVSLSAEPDSAQVHLLTELAISGAVALEELYFGRCGKSPVALDALCRCLTRCRALRVLTLSWPNQPRGIPPAVLPLVADLPSLQALGLDGAPLVSAEAGDELGRCTGLTKLAIACHEFTPQSVRALARSMRSMTDLRSLNLRWNEPTEDLVPGAHVLRAVQGMTRLTLMHLSCEFGLADECEDLLARALRGMHALQDLWLRAHPVPGTRGGVGVVEAVTALRALRAVGFAGAFVRGRARAVLDAALHQMPALREVLIRPAGVPHEQWVTLTPGRW